MTKQGHRVRRLVRSNPQSETDILWSPINSAINKAALDGTDAVVHLAGESIARGRWTPERKARIRDSRVQGTRFLCETLASLSSPPKVVISASASGYYGNRASEVLREESTAGNNFLSEVCREWELATQAASDKGIRVVNLRFGIVLSAAGGALAVMLLPFKMGVGGRVGSGNQYWSWIAIDDVVAVIHHALNTVTLQGPVNTVAPNPVTNSEFTEILGRVLLRPAIFPMPVFAARLALGEMADELLLASARMEPARLLASEYTFRYPELEGALYHLLR